MENYTEQGWAFPAISAQVVSGNAMAISRDLSMAESPLAMAPAPAPGPAPTNNDIHRNLANIAIVRLHELHDLLSIKTTGGSLESKKMAVAEYFAPFAQVSLSLNLANDPRHYTFLYSLLSFLSLEMANCNILSEITCKLVRVRILQDGSISLESPKVTKSVFFPDGSKIVHKGSLRVFLNHDLKIERYDISLVTKTASVELDVIEHYLGSGNKPQFLARDAGMSKYGIRDSTLRLLQIGDVMTLMKPLMTFYTNKGLDSPLKSLEAFNTSVNMEPRIARRKHEAGISPKTITPKESV